MSLTRPFNLALPCVVLFFGLACAQPEPSTSTTTPVPSESEGPSESMKVVEQAASPVESALRAAKRPFSRATIKLTDVQLDELMATEYEVFDSSDPALRIFVLHYEDKSLAKPAKVARWINQSGLVHHAECTANSGRVVAIGSQSADPLTDEHRQATNDFMDAFMIGRY